MVRWSPRCSPDACLGPVKFISCCKCWKLHCMESRLLPYGLVMSCCRACASTASGCARSKEAAGCGGTSSSTCRSGARLSTYLCVLACFTSNNDQGCLARCAGIYALPPIGPAGTAAMLADVAAHSSLGVPVDPTQVQVTAPCDCRLPCAVYMLDLREATDCSSTVPTCTAGAAAVPAGGQLLVAAEAAGVLQRVCD